MLPAQNRPLKPAGEWNQSRVVSNGTTVEHYLNGTKVLSYELDSPALRAAIEKSKFKDIDRFGKLQNGFILRTGPRRPRLVSEHQDQTAARVRNEDVGGSDDTWREGRAGHRERERQAGRHHHRRQAVHVVHLSRHAEEADAVSASHGQQGRS